MELNLTIPISDDDGKICAELRKVASQIEGAKEENDRVNLRLVPMVHPIAIGIIIGIVIGSIEDAH